jgi:hypothetical protein
VALPGCEPGASITHDLCLRIAPHRIPGTDMVKQLKQLRGISSGTARGRRFPLRGIREIGTQVTLVATAESQLRVEKRVGNGRLMAMLSA